MNEFTSRLQIYTDRIGKTFHELMDYVSDRRKYLECNPNLLFEFLPDIGVVYEVLDMEIEDFAVENEYEKGCKYYFMMIPGGFDITRDFNDYEGYSIKVWGRILDKKFRVVSKEDYQVTVTNLIIVPNDERIINDPKITKVYLMIDKNTGYYKIGRSKNPLRREKTLQSEKPTIEMIYFTEATDADEKVLHDMFSDKRIRGEWFDLNGSDLLKAKNYFNGH